MTAVVLHIGLPKTGTTTIQAALDASAPALAGHGVLLPCGGHRGQRLAAYDLIGQRVPGHERSAVAGAWDRLVEEVDAFDGRRVVVSEEELGRARPGQVRRLVRTLDGHDLVVVVGVRDLARTLVSAWQQSVVMGGTTSWSDFVAAVREPGAGSLRAGTSFALRHDPLRVLRTWGAHVPPERIRVVTVPPPGAPAPCLLERFGDAAELPREAWRTGVPSHNDSLGAVEVELLRRVNASLGGRLRPAAHRYVVEEGIRREWRVPGSRSLVLPAQDWAWVSERSRAIVDGLAAGGYPIHGDLSDLVPGEPSPDGRRPDDVTDAELAAAAESALISLAVAHARLHRRHRRSLGGTETPPVTRSQALASATRAAALDAQRRALVLADRAPGVDRAVSALRRLDSRRRRGR
ncbi:hypothetical protein ASG88_15520 [Nocardioides sp. Soil777]|uniref:hypothetical protein n=1 Tax=Nocardioides sp. Soil777 TaxID=1736409 RepID=UPI00070334E0|nr:hypothetical protein [Nocardioides sp. Soil777]KRE99135.1 hypothetical protein ASG88_15520 [Nocardioides sp. Soil777]